MERSVCTTKKCNFLHVHLPRIDELLNHLQPKAKEMGYIKSSDHCILMRRMTMNSLHTPPTIRTNYIPQSGTGQADSQTLPLLELEADPRMGSESLTYIEKN
jgi:hypothetical protein